MPEIRVSKPKKEKSEDISHEAIPKQTNRKGKVEVSQYKIIAEASKYVEDVNKTVFCWKKIRDKKLVPEVREQATLANLNDKVYLFGGLSHD